MQRIERRDFWVVLLLGLVTCGIYTYYFIYKTTQEFNQMAGDDGETIDPTMTIVFLFLTCGIYLFWWYYKMGNRIQALANKNNVYVTEDGGAYLLWMIVGNIICGVGSLIAQYLYLKNFNLLVDAYNAHFDPSGGSYPPPPTDGGGGGATYETPFPAPPQQGTSQPIQPIQPPQQGAWVAPAAPAVTPASGSHDPFMPSTGAPVGSHDPFMPAPVTPEPVVTEAPPVTETGDPSVNDSFAQLLASVETPEVAPPVGETPADATDLPQPPTIPTPPDLPPVE